MRRGWLFAAAVAAAVLVGAFMAAMLSANAKAADPATYCLNGVSTTMPADVFASSESDGDFTATLYDEDATWILDNSPDGVFYLGYSAEDATWYIMVGGDPETFFEPGYSTNTIGLGACASDGVAAPYVHVPRSNFWLCYSKNQTNPGVYPRGQAETLYSDGYTVPYAAQDPLSDTMIGNGIYLTCTMPTGYSIKPGVAVSTGGGDLVTGSPEFVAYVLKDMPLDYTTLITK